MLPSASSATDLTTSFSFAPRCSDEAVAALCDCAADTSAVCWAGDRPAGRAPARGAVRLAAWRAWAAVPGWAEAVPAGRLTATRAAPAIRAPVAAAVRGDLRT